LVLLCAVANGLSGFSALLQPERLPGQLEVGLFTLNATAGSALYAGLLVAWLRRAAIGPPLALAVASIQCYLVLIVLWCNLWTGVQGAARVEATSPLFLLLGVGWFVIHFVLGLDAISRTGRADPPSRRNAGITLPGSPDGRERWIIGLAAFFIIVAVLVELPWLLLSGGLPRLGGFFGQIWAFYGRADRGYYDQVSPFERGLESFQIIFTQWLLVWLIIAIFRRWRYRPLLQIVIGSYVAYSTAVYLAAKHMTGYALMPEHSVGAMLTLYLANMPWVIGNLFIVADGMRSTVRFLRPAEAGP
jgi:hypothetical protein